MKRALWMVLATALAATGCISVSLPDGRKLWGPGTAEKEKEPPPVHDPGPPLPVTDDQINEANAPEKAEALREELDYAAAHPPAAPSTVVSRPGNDK
jgi:hypothetical protein